MQNNSRQTWKRNHFPAIGKGTATLVYTLNSAHIPSETYANKYFRNLKEPIPIYNFKENEAIQLK